MTKKESDKSEEKSEKPVKAPEKAQKDATEARADYVEKEKSERQKLVEQLKEKKRTQGESITGNLANMKPGEYQPFELVGEETEKTQSSKKSKRVITNDDFSQGESSTPKGKAENSENREKTGDQKTGKPAPQEVTQYADHKESRYADGTVVKDFKDGYSVTYDKNNRITKIEFVPVSQDGPRETYEITYGKDGKISKVTHSEPGPPPASESFQSKGDNNWIRTAGGKSVPWKGSFIFAEQNVLIMEEQKDKIVSVNKRVYGSEVTSTDNISRPQPKPETNASEKSKPVDEKAMEKAADELYSAAKEGYFLGAGTSEEKIYAILKDKTEAERKAIDAAYQKKYGETLTEMFKGEMEGADLDKALNLLNRKDGSADEAGRIHSSLIEASQYIEGRSQGTIEKDLRDTVAVLNSKEIEALDAEYQKRYGTSLKEALLKDENLSQDTREALEIYLKGSDKRTDADTLKIANIALKNRDLEMFQEAFGPASQSAREAFIKDGGETKMLAAFGTPDTSIKSIFKNVLSAGLSGIVDSYEAVKGDRLNQAKEIAAQGSISEASEIKASTSYLGDNEESIKQSLDRMSDQKRQDYFRGKELAGGNESNLSPADKKALEYYRSTREALEAAGNQTEIQEWEDRIRSRGGTLITKIAGERGIDDNESNVYKHLENMSQKDWERLKKDPAFRKEIETTIGSFMSQEELKRAQDILDKKFQATSYKDSLVYGKRPLEEGLADFAGLVNHDERGLVEFLSNMSPEEQKRLREDKDYREDVENKIKGILSPGPELDAARNLIDKVLAGKQPTLDIVTKLNLHAGERNEKDQLATAAGIALAPLGIGVQMLVDQYGNDSAITDTIVGSNARSVIEDLETAFKEDPGLRERIKANPDSEEAKQFYAALKSAMREGDFERYARPLIETGELPAEVRLKFNENLINDNEIQTYEDLAKFSWKERNHLLTDPEYQAKSLEFLNEKQKEIAREVIKQGEFRPEDKARAYMLGVGTDTAPLKDLLAGLSPEQKEAVKQAYLQKYGDDLLSDVMEELGGKDQDAAVSSLLREPVTKSEALARARDQYLSSREGAGSAFVDTFWDGTGYQADKAYNQFRTSVIEASSKFQELPPEEQKRLMDNLRQSLEAFQNSKEGAADAVTDATIAIVGVGGAVFTGGVSLSLLAATGAAGAILKVGIKAGIMGNDYDFESSQLVTDLASGFVDASLSVLGPGEVGALLKIGEKAGLKAAGQVAKELGENALKSGLKDGAEEILKQKSVELIRQTVTSGAKGIDDKAIKSIAENIVKEQVDSGALKLSREELVERVAQSLRKELADSINQESKTLLRRSLEEATFNSIAGTAGGAAGAAVRWDPDLSLEDNLKRIGTSAAIGGGAAAGFSSVLKGGKDTLDAFKKVEATPDTLPVATEMPAITDPGRQTTILDPRQTGILDGNKTGIIDGNQTGMIDGNQTGIIDGNQTGIIDGNQTGSLDGNSTGNIDRNQTGDIDGDKTADLDSNKTEAPETVATENVSTAPVAEIPEALNRAGYTPTEFQRKLETAQYVPTGKTVGGGTNPRLPIYKTTIDGVEVEVIFHPLDPSNTRPAERFRKETAAGKLNSELGLDNGFPDTAAYRGKLADADGELKEGWIQYKAPGAEDLGKRFENIDREAAAQLLDNDPALRNQFEQAFVERILHGDLDSNAGNFLIVEGRNGLRVQNIDLEQALPSQKGSPIYKTAFLEVGARKYEADSFLRYFSEQPLSAETRSKLQNFIGRVESGELKAQDFGYTDVEFNNLVRRAKSLERKGFPRGWDIIEDGFPQARPDTQELVPPPSVSNSLSDGVDPNATGNFKKAPETDPYATGNFTKTPEVDPYATGNFTKAPDVDPYATGNFSRTELAGEVDAPETLPSTKEAGNEIPPTGEFPIPSTGEHPIPVTAEFKAIPEPSIEPLTAMERRRFDQIAKKFSENGPDSITDAEVLEFQALGKRLRPNEKIDLERAALLRFEPDEQFIQKASFVPPALRRDIMDRFDSVTTRQEIFVQAKKDAALRNYSDFTDYVQNGLENVKHEARVYKLTNPDTEIVLTESYAKKLDEVRQLRALAEKSVTDSPFEVAQILDARRRLEAHPFKNAILPEQVAAMIDELPNPDRVKKVMLYDSESPNAIFDRQKNPNTGEAVADASIGRGVIRYFNEDLSDPKWARLVTYHEWSHLAQNGSAMKAFALAEELEDKFQHLRSYAKTNVDEDFAVHFGEALLNPDASVAKQLGEIGPLRAIVLTEALKEELLLNPNRHPYARELSERLKHVEFEVLPTAQKELANMLDSSDQAQVKMALGLLKSLKEIDPELAFKLTDQSVLARIAQTTTSVELAKDATTLVVDALKNYPADLVRVLKNISENPSDEVRRVITNELLKIISPEARRLNLEMLKASRNYNEFLWQGGVVESLRNLNGLQMSSVFEYALLRTAPENRDALARQVLLGMPEEFHKRLKETAQRVQRKTAEMERAKVTGDLN